MPKIITNKRLCGSLHITAISRSLDFSLRQEAVGNEDDAEESGPENALCSRRIDRFSCVWELCFVLFFQWIEIASIFAVISGLWPVW